MKCCLYLWTYVSVVLFCVLARPAFAGTDVDSHKISADPKYSTPYRATFKVANVTIPEVIFSNAKDGPLLWAFTDEFYHLYVRFSGVFARPDSGAFFYMASSWQKAEVSETGMFEFDLPLTGERTDFKIMSVNELGVTRTEDVTVFLSNYNGLLEDLKVNGNMKQNYFDASLGFMVMNYTDSRIPNVSETALTVSGSYKRVIIPGRVDAEISGYAMALPLSYNSTFPIRLFGASAVVGYFFPSASTWHFGILGGVYGLTTYEQSNQWGFSGMLGPQLYPTIRKTLKHNDSLSGYVKYSPTSDGPGGFTFTSNELAAGIKYTHPWGPAIPVKRNYIISLDFIQDTVVLSGVNISSQSFTLSGGILF